MTPPPLAYRPGVGIVLFNAEGKVFLGLRSDGRGTWQLPQGGIAPGEEPRAAALRELEEEIGTARAEILAETDWLSYDLPEGIRKRLWGGRYRGQRQKWFAMRFLGRDEEIDLDRHAPEFSAWRWGELGELPKLAVGFERPLYETLADTFRHFAAASGP